MPKLLKLKVVHRPSQTGYRICIDVNKTIRELKVLIEDTWRLHGKTNEITANNIDLCFKNKDNKRRYLEDDGATIKSLGLH